MRKKQGLVLSYQNHYCAFMVPKQTSFNAAYAKKHVIRDIWKRKKISEIKSKHIFKSNAILWQEYYHSYANVFSNVDWNSEETLHSCKSCKVMSSKENLRKAQQKKESDTSNNDESNSSNVPERPDTSTEGRSQRAKRDAFRYSSSPQDPLCIICNVIYNIIFYYIYYNIILYKLGRKFQLR